VPRLARGVEAVGAGWAGYRYCAAHSRWYWWLKLPVITAPDGMPVAWCLASPAIGEREVAAGVPAGAYVRIAQWPLAMATVIRHNWQAAQPVKRSLTAYDH
jgi:hypothetical protein